MAARRSTTEPANGAADRPLAGRVAVVTGASRGAGRGIAIELGAAGCTVYVTGRTTRAEQPTSYERFKRTAGLAAMPGTIDDTAEEVTRQGGTGIAVRCDHTRDEEVRALFERVEREQGRLDVLVNNAWGGHETMDTTQFGQPFWKVPMDNWEGMFDRGVRNHLLACHTVAPFLIGQGHGLIVTTSFFDRGQFLGTLFYDLAKHAMVRLALGVAEELRPHGIASVAVAPGWMRTELVLAGHHTDEAGWRERPALARTESPRYVGRAVVALARDPDIMARSGGAYRVGDLATEYGFTDIDGRVVPPFEIGPKAEATEAEATEAEATEGASV